MKIVITRPFGPKHPFEIEFLRYWDVVSRKLTSQAVVICENAPYETHGDLLTRIWTDLRNTKEPILISESDFWPYQDEIADLLHHAQRCQRAACFTPMAKSLSPSEVEKFKIVPQFYEPLVAPWFMLLLPEHFHADPPLNWLAAGGPLNDAANLAYLRAVESGTLYAPDVKWFQQQKSLGPVIKGDTCALRYLHGAHFFFTRHWSDPPERELLPNGYTVGTHLSIIEHWLEHRRGK